MNILKEAGVGQSEGVSKEDLALINALSRKELSEEEVYVFPLRLCDNEIDREGERFPRETLEDLAELFVGKCGIFDHNWSATGQTARIYRTEVVEETGKMTRAGDGACYLKGWAYMLRTEGNSELIQRIEGGIQKEVSVGCAVEREVCSVCGEDMESCHHVKGRSYNGKLCWGELVGATDAYEFSFVAVPAQRQAGVIKSMEPCLKDLCRGNRKAGEELRELEKDAAMGRKYLASLRAEVARLAGASEPELRVEWCRKVAEKLDEEELLALKEVLFRRGKSRWDGKPQLNYGNQIEDRKTADGAFMV